jgi:hypothetical protein
MDVFQGRAIAQEVSGWLPTAAARIWSCGICGGQSGAEAGFLRVLRFPLPIFILPIAPQSPSSIICGWYNRPVVSAVPSELSLTGLTPLIKIIIIIIIITTTTTKGGDRHAHINISVPGITTARYRDT